MQKWEDKLKGTNANDTKEKMKQQHNKEEVANKEMNIKNNHQKVENP